MVDTQHFCLRWNNYQSSITSAFENLRDDEDFVDVTLACDGKSLKAHRVVLSACSPYFRELLKSTPCKHPVIVLQDVAFTDLHALVEFIYHGEVNVHQRSLTSFLKTAEVLRVSGLTQHDDAQGPLAQFQQMTGRAAPAPSHHSPLTPHAPPPHPPRTPNFSEKLEEALLAQPPPTVQQLMRRGGGVLPLARRLSRSSDNSPDVIKRARHDNNNTEQASHMPQISPADFSAKALMAGARLNHDGNNGNGISNSSGSPSPGLDVVKHEPLDMMCGPADVERSNDTPPHSHPHHRSHMGPPSRGSSADAEDRTPPLQMPPSPFLQPSEPKLFAANSYNFSMAALADHSALAGLGSPGMNADGLAGTSQVGPLGAGHRCDVCGKLLSTRLTLKRHTEQQHLQPLHSARCTLCHKVFRTLNSLNNHKSIYHRRQRSGPPAAAGAAPPELAPAAHAHRAPDLKLPPAHHVIDNVFYKFKDQYNI